MTLTSKPLKTAGICFALVLIVLGSQAYGQFVIGGWDDSRGGHSAIATGGAFAGGRQLIAANEPTLGKVTYTTTPTLTPEFLAEVDAVILSMVRSGAGDDVAALTMAEQDALRNFVIGGGGAILVADNTDFPTSNSMVAPFGVTMNVTGDIQLNSTAAIVNHTAIPLVTDGPFGVVDTINGFQSGYFTTTDSGSVLAQFGPTTPAILGFGGAAGRMVMYSDSNLLPTGLGGDGNALFLNAVNYVIPEPSSVWLVLAALAVLCLAKSARIPHCASCDAASRCASAPR